MPTQKKKQRNVCYTGIYANKKGFYTQPQFMKTMKRHFRKKCSQYIRSRKCSPCIQSRRLNMNYTRKLISAAKKNETYVLDPKAQQKMVDMHKKCKECETAEFIPCDLADYKAYSGALFCDGPLPQPSASVV